MKEKLYVTPRMIKDFQKQTFLNGSRLVSFPKLLRTMKEQNLLSRELLPAPALDGRMDKIAFMEAYDSIPFEVNRELKQFSAEREQNERVLFPANMDILCMQQLLQDTSLDQTIHNVYAFTYVYEGCLSYTFDEETLQLNAGNIFIATPGFSHKIYTMEGTFALVLMFRSTAFQILFNDFLTANSLLSEFFRQTIADKKLGNYCVIKGNEDDEELRFYLQSLICECHSSNAYANSSAASLLKLFLSRAYNKYSDQITFYKRNFQTVRADTHTILTYIETNYQSISLSQLAEHFHYNPTYISRFIHQHFGKTFTELVNELKIEHAKEYLRKTNKQIAEIASIAGFESYDHFSRTFRQYTGMPPGIYRKKSRDSFQSYPVSAQK